MAERQNWLLRSAGIAAAVVVFISATLGLWFTMESRMKDAMAENTTRLTLEIKKAATSVAGLHRDDLAVRIRILKREIAADQEAGHSVPERLFIQLEAMQDQLEEVKEIWFEQQ